MYYVYILQGDKYYCGYTHNIENRITQHLQGKTYTTKRIGTFKLLGYFLCKTQIEATQLERKIKRSKHIVRFLEHQEFMRI